jgi:hypothetical protein
VPAHHHIPVKTSPDFPNPFIVAQTLDYAFQDFHRTIPSIRTVAAVSSLAPPFLWYPNNLPAERRVVCSQACLSEITISAPHQGHSTGFPFTLS